MGAQQSSGRDSSPQTGAAPKTCYYEVLGVDRHATDEDVKKAYRRKALELHPDRNYGDVENATVKFAEVSSAYEVLSDPQERAWYDSHRESILRGDGGSEDDAFEHNVRLTSAGDLVSLIGKFNSKVPFTDASNGFYGILRDTFARLASEESSAADWDGLEKVDYPDYGYAADNHEEGVKHFYKVWINFTTRKTFSWRDAYRAGDAPDRATRRLVEKENKRLRDEGIREFNDTVRSLVVFVRKRDPRYIPSSQSEADRQKILRDAAAAQAARSRAANLAKLNEHVVPEWAKSNAPEEREEFTDSEESEVEHIECVVCSKTFKSEKQYETHEKSKKHIKAVQQLQREMRKENRLLNLDSPANSSIPTSPLDEMDQLHLNPDEHPVETSPVPDREDNEVIQASSEDSQNLKDHPPNSQASPKADGETIAHPVYESSESEDEYASRQDVENRLNATLVGKDTETSALDTGTHAKVSSEAPKPQQQKLGKAKAKRAKKAARQETQGPHDDVQFKCAACYQPFASKTKLFDHLKENPNHAQPVLKASKGKNKKR